MAPEGAAGEQVSFARPATAAPPPPEPAPAPAPQSEPRLELTHRRHLLCLGAGDSRGQDPGEETTAQHLPSCKRRSQGLQQQLQQGPPPPGAGRAPTRDQRPRATPCTAGDTPERETSGRVPRAESTYKAEEGLRPQHARQWFRPAVAAPWGGASSLRPAFSVFERGGPG